MSEQNQACYTFEGAIEAAVRMEEEGFRNYLRAIRLVQDKAAKSILKDAALDELEHKHQLEKALVEGQVEGHTLDRPAPTMNLDYILAKKELAPDADGRKALAFAIRLEKGSLEFYNKMIEGCAGAPMASLFEKIANDETRHLQSLEDLYEAHYMPEN